jgi:DNA-binding IclR family transcriptional regulator
VVSRHTQQVLSGATATRTGAARVQSVERAAALLRAVAAASGASATATALAETVGLNRTTTWRILATLEQQGLVSLDRTAGRYTLGFGLIDLAGQAGGAALVRSARAVLRRIAAKTGETAALAVMRDGALVYVAEETPDVAFLAGWLGREASLHATATGKALLAFADPDHVRDLLQLPRGGRLPRFTSSTTTSLTELQRELRETRARGYSVSRGEAMESAWGVSAPVLDAVERPVAILSLWGPPERVTEERLGPLGRVVLRGAEEIAGRRPHR